MKNTFKMSNHIGKFAMIILCIVCVVLYACSPIPNIANNAESEQETSDVSTPEENITVQNEVEQDTAEDESKETAPEEDVESAGSIMKQSLADNRTAGKDKTKEENDGEYIGTMTKFLLPEDVTIDENNCGGSNGAEFVYMNTPYDGTFITFTVSTLPDSEMTLDDCRDMYIRFLDSIDAVIISEEEIEDAVCPYILINAMETVQSSDGSETIEMHAVYIIFLEEDKMCAIVGGFADKNDEDAIFELCMEIFDSFELTV